MFHVKLLLYCREAACSTPICRSFMCSRKLDVAPAGRRSRPDSSTLEIEDERRLECLSLVADRTDAAIVITDSRFRTPYRFSSTLPTPRCTRCCTPWPRPACRSPIRRSWTGCISAHRSVPVERRPGHVPGEEGGAWQVHLLQ